MNTQYDNISSDYHKHMLKHDRTGKKDVIDTLGLIDKQINILEYGCGTGIEAGYLLADHSNIEKYIGIDNAQSMLDEFNKHITDPRVKTELADIDTYTPEESTYDLVFAMFTIHYTNDIASLMKKVYAALKPGGYFMFRDAHPFVGLFKKVSKKYDVKENVEFPLAGGGSGIFVTHPTFTFDEYINAAVEAGFKIQKVVEKMGAMSKELGIEGYEIPTTVIFYLKKE